MTTVHSLFIHLPNAFCQYSQYYQRIDLIVGMFCILLYSRHVKGEYYCFLSYNFL